MSVVKNKRSIPSLDDGHDRENDAGVVKKLKRKQSNIMRQVDANSMIDTKRARTVPPTESKFKQWLFDNIEAKPGFKLHMNSVYDHYTLSCQNDSCSAVELHIFKKRIKNELGAELGLKDGSLYKGIIKVHKNLPHKPRNESEKLKRELIIKAIEHYGNPAGGVLYRKIYQFLLETYPALRLADRPNLLKTVLMLHMRYDHVILVKGIGKCGYYRLPGGAGDEESYPQKKVVSEGGDGEKDTDNSTEGEDGDSGGKEGDKEGDNEGDKEGKDEGVKKKKSKPKKVSATTHIAKARHSDPHRIDDVLPLAFTYMSDPKTASLVRIKTYIAKYFNLTNVDDRIRAALESGIKVGVFEKVGGSYALLVDDLNPCHTKMMEDKICLAILAAHTPKQASGRLIKQYVLSYHTDLKVAERPQLFKNALERCINGGLIRQVSGIGAGGSFELVESFIPGPRILAGLDREEYEEDSGVEYESSGDEAGEDKDEPDSAPKYIPKPTRSGRGVTKSSSAPMKIQHRKPPTVRTSLKPVVKKRNSVKTYPSKKVLSATNKASPKSNRAAVAREGRGKIRSYAEDDSVDESENDEDEVPASLKMCKVSLTREIKGNKRQVQDEADDEGEEQETVRRAKPTAKKGRERNLESSSKNDDVDDESEEERQTLKKKAKSSPVRRNRQGKVRSYVEDGEDIDDEYEERQISRTKAKPSPKKIGRERKVTSYTENDDSVEDNDDGKERDEDEDEQTSVRRTKASVKEVMVKKKASRK